MTVTYLQMKKLNLRHIVVTEARSNPSLAGSVASEQQFVWSLWPVSEDWDVCSTAGLSLSLEGEGRPAGS